MIKVTCDRCGKQIGVTLPWTTLEFPVLTITSKASAEENPWMIDLCRECKVKFYDWLDTVKNEPISCSKDGEKDEDHV